jgi:hypothetical protein
MKAFNLEKYTSYFHDGTVHDIKYIKNTIIISIESAELRPEWNEDNIALSKRNTISGNLHLENFGNIRINGKIYKEKLVKTYDSSDVYTFEIHARKVLLLISWINYPPKRREETPFSEYEIEAEKIYWENIPTLFDISLDSEKSSF